LKTPKRFDTIGKRDIIFRKHKGKAEAKKGSKTLTKDI
jgi:hypothetical protein